MTFVLPTVNFLLPTTPSGGGASAAVNVSYVNSASGLISTNVQDAIDEVASIAGGGAIWGNITGILANQTDLQSALNGKQASLVSGINIKTINGSSVIGSGELTVTGAVASVNGGTGTVVLDADDIDDIATAHKFASQAQIDKLAGIESGATADQTAVEIKTAYESNLDTNAFTDAEQSKLTSVEVNANNYVHPNHIGDVTSSGDGATTISAGAVTNAKMANMAANTIKGRSSTIGAPQDLTALQARTLLNVEDGATADQTAGEIKTAYESNLDTNAFTDSEKSKLAGVATGATANSTDATLLARTNHTGAQLASTISDFDAAADARIAASNKISSDVTGVTGADAITNMISLTQAEFDAIVTPSATVVYLITDAV